MSPVAPLIATEPLLTLKDMKERYRVSAMTIWRWCRSGALPPPIKFSEAKNSKPFWSPAAVAERERAHQQKGPQCHS